MMANQPLTDHEIEQMLGVSLDTLKNDKEMVVMALRTMHGKGIEEGTRNTYDYYQRVYRARLGHRVEPPAVEPVGQK